MASNAISSAQIPAEPPPTAIAPDNSEKNGRSPLLQNGAAIFDMLPHAVVVLDKALTLQHCNRKAENLLQISLSHKQGNTLESLPFYSQKLRDFAEASIENQLHIEEAEFALPCLSQSGNHLATITLQLQPAIDSHTNQVMGVIICFVSQNTNFINRHSHVASMAAILAHEIKNPLASIRAAGQFLQNTLPTEKQSLPTIICDEVERVRAIIDGMEFFSDERALSVQPHNIHALLQQTIELLKGHYPQLNLIESYDPSLPEVAADATLLAQAFSNILFNAAEALTEVSESDETASKPPRTEPPRIEVRSYYRSGHHVITPRGERYHTPIIIEIRDNGNGVPAEIQSSLFEPFISTKPSGKGLGLAIVAHIIAKHFGTIDYIPLTPNGSCFQISLPVST